MFAAVLSALSLTLVIGLSVYYLFENKALQTTFDGKLKSMVDQINDVNRAQYDLDVKQEEELTQIRLGLLHKG